MIRSVEFPLRHILIVEDEKPAFRRLYTMVQKLAGTEVTISHTDSVEATLSFLKSDSTPDIIFMDIQLSDGLSFMIFQMMEVKVPVVFTTAYDEYALQAFRVNALDYLLKPIDESLLEAALSKLSQRAKPQPVQDYASILAGYMEQALSYRDRRLLLKRGDQWVPVSEQQVAYVWADHKYVWVVTHTDEHFLSEETLETLEHKFSKTQFFRVNRKFLIAFSSILKIHTHFNSRLKLELKPAQKQEVIVSRERVSDFKTWLNH